MKTKNNKKVEKELFTDDHGIVCQEVRLLPYGGDGNIIVGRVSYDKEMQFRKIRNKTVCSPYDIPSWESLEVYLAE
jgi:hypothetical protein